MNGTPQKLIAPAATPLTGAGGIDHALLSAHVRRLLGNGMDQALLFGTTGEGTTFSATQKCTALDALLAAGIAGSRLLVGTGTSVLSDAAHVVTHAANAGCAGALVLPPFYPKGAGEAGVAAWFAALARRTAPAPILLYNIPQTAGVGFTPDAAAILMERFPSIVGLKDSSAGSAVADALVARGLRNIYAAQDSGLMRRRVGGTAGLISATLDVAPGLARAALDGDVRAFDSFCAISRAMDPYPLVWSIKVLLARIENEPRWRAVTPPHREASPEDARSLTAAFDSLLHPKP